MKKWLNLLAVAGLLALGYLAWQWLFPPPEKVIRKRLTSLASILSVSPGSGGFATLNAAANLRDFFTPNVAVSASGLGRYENIEGRDELVQLLMAARQRFRGDVSLHDIHVTVAPEGDRAQVHLAALVQLEGERDPFAAELKIAMLKEGKAWLIERVDPVRSAPLEIE